LNHLNARTKKIFNQVLGCFLVIFRDFQPTGPYSGVYDKIEKILLEDLKVKKTMKIV